MNDTVVALYDARNDARAVRDDLIHAGFNDDSISLVGQPPAESTVATKSTAATGKSWWEDVKGFFGFGDEGDRDVYQEGVRRGGTFVAVDSPSDRVDEAVDILMGHNAVDVERRAADWRAAGWQGQPLTPRDTTAKASSVSQQTSGAVMPEATTRPAPPAISRPATAPAATSRPAAAASGRGEQAIPIVEEELQVGKRQVRRGVRIYQHVTEKPVEKQVQLRDERVTVERRPADRPATNVPGAFQERTFEVTETHEEPVVSKQARVVGEVVVNRQSNERTETVRDTVRRTDVDVQQSGAAAGKGTSTGAAPSQPDEQELRRLYEADYPGQRASWEQYRPAYQLGQELATDQRLRGSDWPRIEADARLRFEQAHPNDKWDQVKDAVHRSYDRARIRT